MDLLKRALAPITDQAWEQIEQMAKRVLKTQLTARKFVDVVGPKGWDQGAVALGRLEVPPDQSGREVEYGVHRVQPLVETRARFELDIWELDNAVRGAKDIDLDALIAATRSAAQFEDQAVFKGFEPGGIEGLEQAARQASLELAAEATPFLDTVSEAMLVLETSAIGGPYALVLGAQAFRFAASSAAGYPLLRNIERLIDGPVIHSAEIEGGFLVSTRGGDFELSLGQDYSIGYESSSNRKVMLFLTESFTFRVLEPMAFVPLAYRS